VNASDTQSPRIVEEQLQGKQANLDGALRWYSGHVGGVDAAHLTRLELRYPSRTAARIDEAVAHQRIRNLLEDKAFVARRGGPKAGADVIPVSVRQHELDMDNDLNQLTVRAIFKLPPKQVGDSGKGWFKRLLQLFQPEDDTDAYSAEPAGIPTQQAMDTLLRGLEQAAEQFKRNQESNPSAAIVGGVLVTVSAPELHHALGPRLSPPNTEDATKWVAKHLRGWGLEPAHSLKLTYRFVAPTSEHTKVVSDGPLKVSLTPPLKKEADDATNQGRDAVDTVMPAPSPDAGTPMPQRDPAPSAAGPSVKLRLLGTWQGGALVPLATAFECNLGPVPTLFSRTTLETQGFTQRADAALARAASNSTPLHFSANGQGGIKLHAAHRPGTELAMYFFADGLAPCAGEHPLTGPVRLVANGPAPLEDGLFPLVIEVSSGG